MMPTKKIVLFIVEGISDETSLALILSKLNTNTNIRFHIVGGDITSDRNTTASNARTKVNEQVKIFLSKNKFVISDIMQIVHVVDMDGAYISEANIIEDKGIHKWVYEDNKIITNHKAQTKERNNKKSEILDILTKTPTIRKVPYMVIYFSCNLEHVMHNIRNASMHEKDHLADAFVERFYRHEADFINFMKSEDFAVDGNYIETWDFIKQGCNSLNRFSNFCLYFKV